MSHSKPFVPVISPTLHDRPRTNLVPWKVAINRAACAVFAEWDDFGFLFGECDDAIWAVLNSPPGGVLRDRPEFPVPAALGAGANPAARDVFKRATDSRASWLACSASFCAAILDSIGDANRLAIADPDTDTLHLSPLDIIIAMTVYPNPLYPTINSAQQQLYPPQYYDSTSRVFHPTPHGIYATPQPYLPTSWPCFFTSPPLLDGQCNVPLPTRPSP
jgi:hypothetical protein